MKQCKINKLDFNGQDIYVGIDVHKKNWTVCILTADREHKKFTMDPKSEILVNYLRKNFPNANYHTVYEAGYSGFWVHEQLSAAGINSIVANPADIPTTGKEKLNKTDSSDSRKLARSLRNGELTAIYTPENYYQEARSLVRTRYQFTNDQTRAKNRIKSCLSFYGIIIPEELVKSHWSRRYIKYLQEIALMTPNGTNALHAHIEHLLMVRIELLKVTRQIRSLSKEAAFKEDIEFLISIPGIGPITAIVFLTEIIDINRFKTLDNLASFIGLAPREHSSSDKIHIGGLTKRGNKYLRNLLIEAAWIASRRDPALTMSYNKYVQKDGIDKRKAIIKIARKLLNRMRYVLKNHQPYVEGVVE
jgi:transposase